MVVPRHRRTTCLCPWASSAGASWAWGEPHCCEPPGVPHVSGYSRAHADARCSCDSDRGYSKNRCGAVRSPDAGTPYHDCWAGSQDAAQAGARGAYRDAARAAHSAWVPGAAQDARPVSVPGARRAWAPAAEPGAYRASAPDVHRASVPDAVPDGYPAARDCDPPHPSTYPCHGSATCRHSGALHGHSDQQTRY